MTVRFEVFTAVTMKNGVFWDVALVRKDVSEEFSASNSPDYGGAKSLRNVGSYKSHTS
jgi:hypothetical protein